MMSHVKITAIRIGEISVPLRTPFKTAVRTAYSVEDVIVEVHTDSGIIGFGEAPPTGLITGDTKGAIIGALREHIIPSIVGMDLDSIEEVLVKLNGCVLHNTSAKAAVDMAVYDAWGQMLAAPLYKLLGGYRREVLTDITISVNSPDEMVRDAVTAVSRGFDVLKIKVGKQTNLDVLRLTSIREAVGQDVLLRVDANQGWTAKEAVRILTQIENAGLDIELVEQPVPAYDIDGLKYVTDHVSIPVMADEAVFSPSDALTILNRRAADIINIKLMKTGGLYNAMKICDIAEINGVECMIGSMLEAKVSVNAAVHLAAARSVITKADLDGPALCSEDPVEGGSVFTENVITVCEDPGLGVRKVNGVTYLD